MSPTLLSDAALAGAGAGTPLGASLYAPATRPDLVALGTTRHPGLGSIIYCTEDAVREEDVGVALATLESALPQLVQQPGPRRFIRARNPAVLRALLAFDLRGIDGFVLPKIHDRNLGAYMTLLADRPALLVMPTLETREALSEHRMLLLRDLIFQEDWQGRVLCFRIGGNDLMSALGVRRAAGRTLYEGPLERVISMLIGVFKPHGFLLSSPVYEVFDDLATLAREVRQDLEYGLSGKTIIHPVQLATVLEGYRVTENDLAEAHAILAPDAPAVFKMNGRMCEPATHARWAHDIVRRAEQYGTLPAQSSEALHF
ncbi:HpcH/HpaI aldolase/citrate lyase family protein (plasmid) [Deinococcus taeanensis]|uniref:HpcH/HpaI aldolase/citrate lyase family protein n=1 Tax=Deinococcus taeanensis TaxID=2737050 RepID=UPI001CDCD319|nr:HpcH/HpaI aldolase/citrate lyase family protein [Deinococcus taeanensis]UBV44620.1 HpcH/HpaI aldolase/citrate lyase family protein [Deinococcus taeanensis]